MSEDKLLDKVMEILEGEDAVKAYDYLVTHLKAISEWTEQAYNFLYCLAAMSDHQEEALEWMEEAILQKGLWYRPEVFEDDDLASIRENDRFRVCEAVSKERYLEALKQAKPLFTLSEKSSDDLIIVLHGNQQNNEISKTYWSKYETRDCQIEYLQSKEVDSHRRFRWNNDGDGPIQVSDALSRANALSFSRIALAGFSAGCNTILRALVEEKVKVDRLILFSPWMPVVNEAVTEIIESLKASNTHVTLVCGTADQDCLPQCKTFEEEALAKGYDCSIHYIENMGHEYPEDMSLYI